jgi:hypothetical protein
MQRVGMKNIPKEDKIHANHDMALGASTVVMPLSVIIMQLIIIFSVYG